MALHGPSNPPLQDVFPDTTPVIVLRPPLDVLQKHPTQEAKEKYGASMERQ